MTAYECMIQVNRYMLQDGVLTDEQRSKVVRILLDARTSEAEANRFYRSVRFPENIDESGRRLYPIYYIPPYNGGKKHLTIFNQTPKTHSFSANVYELEILRLLWVLAPNAPEVIHMIEETLKRLRTTCFGSMDDGIGECFDTSLVVLRFLATVVPHETEWIISRIDNYNRHVAEKKRPWYCKWYYFLCLSELPLELVKNEVNKYKAEMRNWLENKSCVMNSEHDRTIHPVLFCILRNNLAKYPEYVYIKSRKPFVSDKDGRLYFDMKKE